MTDMSIETVSSIIVKAQNFIFLYTEFEL